MSLLGQSDYSKVPPSILHEYAAMDADAGKSIFKPEKLLLKDAETWDYYNGHLRETTVNMIESSILGMKVSMKKLGRLKSYIQDVLASQKRQMQKFAGETFNPNSPDQLKEILFNRLKLPVLETTPTGEPSTNAEVLEELLARTNNKFIRTLTEYRALSKLHSTYVLGFERYADEKAYVHPAFRLAGAITGRITSEGPATTNIPRDKKYKIGGEEMEISLKELFIAPSSEYFFGHVDYSQVELRILAILSGDDEMLRIFAAGLDLHEETARLCYDIAEGTAVEKEMRNIAKTVNFSIVYGASAASVAVKAGVTLDVIERFMAQHRKRFPKLHKFLVAIPEIGLKEEGLVSPFGRRKHVRPYSRGDEKTIAAIKRELGNFLPQNCGMELTARAMNRIIKKFRKHPEWGASVRNIYYDALQFYGKKEFQDEINEVVLMEMLRPVPELDNFVFACDLGVGSNWSKAEKDAKKYHSYNGTFN